MYTEHPTANPTIEPSVEPRPFPTLSPLNSSPVFSTVIAPTMVLADEDKNIVSILSEIYLPLILAAFVLSCCFCFLFCLILRLYCIIVKMKRGAPSTTPEGEIAIDNTETNRLKPPPPPLERQGTLNQTMPTLPLEKFQESLKLGIPQPIDAQLSLTGTDSLYEQVDTNAGRNEMYQE